MKKPVVIDYEQAFNRLFTFFEIESKDTHCHWNCRGGDCDYCVHKRRRNIEYWFKDRKED